MNQRVKVLPTSATLWRIVGIDCNAVLRSSKDKQRQGLWAEACEIRAEAAQRVIDAVGDEPVRLDWEDASSRSALQLLYMSAADYLSIGEVETATALWESVVDLDEEDHLQATVMLAFCYVYLEDYDCLESVLPDISPKSPESALLSLWSAYRRCGGIDRDALRQLRQRHKAWYEEFVAEEHPIDEEFSADARQERPQQRTEAREFWFATAPLWENNSDFLSAIKRA